MRATSIAHASHELSSECAQTQDSLSSVSVVDFCCSCVYDFFDQVIKPLPIVFSMMPLVDLVFVRSLLKLVLTL